MVFLLEIIFWLGVGCLVVTYLIKNDMTRQDKKDLEKKVRDLKFKNYLNDIERDGPNLNHMTEEERIINEEKRLFRNGLSKDDLDKMSVEVSRESKKVMNYLYQKEQEEIKKENKGRFKRHNSLN